VPETALIVVDMLNPYDHEDADLLVRSVAATVDQMAGLIARAGENTLTVYVNDNHDRWDAGREQLVRRALDGRHPELVQPIVPADDAGHDGRVYEITGRELLTLAEAAETMSRATGQRVVFRDETVEEAYASRAGLGPDWEVEGWVTSYTGIAAGELDGLTDTVKRLTGREPGTLAEWLGEHPDALAHVRTP
jgi:nicotinamidase-related amidase